MLKDKDRIFQNLYNDLGSDLIVIRKEVHWVIPKELIDKGRDLDN
jgi:NADH-quinone oxidoreductase subunit F